MNRPVMMTLGFLFVFFGIQLNVVDSYVLTPRMANFFADPNASPQTIVPELSNANGPQFVQTGFNAPNAATSNFPNQVTLSRPNNQANRVIRPPVWWGWPVMFLGAVFFLNGLAIRK